MTLQTVIEGRHEAGILWFVKTYDYRQRAGDPVHYEGTIQADGDEIDGRWTIADFSGTFMMIRKRREAAAEERKVDETVPLGG